MRHSRVPRAQRGWLKLHLRHPTGSGGGHGGRDCNDLGLERWGGACHLCWEPVCAAAMWRCLKGSLPMASRRAMASPDADTHPETARYPRAGIGTWRAHLGFQQVDGSLRRRKEGMRTACRGSCQDGPRELRAFDESLFRFASDGPTYVPAGALVDCDAACQGCVGFVRLHERRVSAHGVSSLCTAGSRRRPRLPGMHCTVMGRGDNGHRICPRTLFLARRNGGACCLRSVSGNDCR